jgi:PAS domain S-box-containing protein
VEEELLAYTRRWQSTFDAINDSICLLDMERRILQSNKATSTFMGLSMENIHGHTCCSLLHKSSEPIKECPFVKMMVTRKRENTVMKLKNQWINISVDPIINKDGKMIGAVHIVSDITDRKRAEEQLIQSEKLAGIGTLASGIAHEINNPLAGIMGYTELLLDDKENEKTRNYAEKILKEAEKTANIIKWLSRYTRQAKDDNILDLQLTQIIDDSLEALKHTRKSYDIQIQKDYQEIPSIKGNKSELQQVFVNLMNNAVDAMPKGGRLDLSTAVKGEYVMVKVSDNGLGIPREKITRIFEPFFTTKEVGEGTGLGLYVTSMIVKKHHGIIDLESEVGKGTTFMLKFPRSGVKN